MSAPIQATDLVDVAAALGWQVKQEPGTFGGVHFTPSDRADGYGIHTWKRPSQDRYEFSVSYPPQSADGWRYTLPYGEHMPSMSVRADRSPDAIAREITRRLLPAYEKVWTHYLEQKAGHDAYVGETLTPRRGSRGRWVWRTTGRTGATTGTRSAFSGWGTVARQASTAT